MIIITLQEQLLLVTASLVSLTVSSIWRICTVQDWKVDSLTVTTLPLKLSHVVMDCMLELNALVSVFNFMIMLSIL